MRGGWSRGARLAAAGLVLGAGLGGPLTPSAAQSQDPARIPALAPECSLKPGGADPGTVPWAQKRLNVSAAWPITQGSGMTVAVVDSGVDQAQPQMAKIRYAPGVRIITGGRGPSDTTDCVGHGTGVAGIIAAPKVQDIGFTGVAPEARIMPIEVANDDQQNISPATIARGINAAIDANVQVINVSIYTMSNVPELRAAVERAERKGIVVVAAASEGQDASRTGYPAAYPTVLAVGATDSSDNPADFTATGSYLDLAAPGAKVETTWANPTLGTGYQVPDGTSFAAPFVSGVAALVRAAHPELTPEQVRNRLEATADPPPGQTVPSDRYGYGIVNPYLAVTAVRDDSAVAGSPGKPVTLPPPVHAKGADRHLQHLALGVGTGLLGLGVLAALTAAVVRRATGVGRSGPTGSNGRPRDRASADLG